MPGGLGPSPHPPCPPSPPDQARARTPPWVRELGSHLSVHNEHGYTSWDMLAQQSQSYKAGTVIRIYFSADWCPPCQVFNPLLKRLHSSMRAHCDKANKNIPHFEMVLVSRCKDARATEQYFSKMPWAAMTHADAAGKRGLALRERFGIMTIPALVLLDGEGVVLCQNAQERLCDDPTGQQFPWRDAPPPPTPTSRF